MFWHILAIIFQVIGAVFTALILSALVLGVFFADEFDEQFAPPLNDPDPDPETGLEPEPQTFTYVVTLDGEFDLFTVDGVSGNPFEEGTHLIFCNENLEELARFHSDHIYSVIRKVA